ncbi:MAG: TraB/GumN family protein [Lewinellaceae bacterium]|nr:TraB/GumN family protein [Phaeodactylibacter sp.]MCB9037051.1 TraB/GumN family protein [Lewinellaceae bacterium]
MRQFCYSIFFTLLAVSAWAQPATSAKYAPTVEENALLWEISGKELANPSYLFGTIHMIGKEDFFLTDATKSSLEKAQQVTFEIDMEDMMDVAKLVPLLMKSFMANDTTLSDLLNEEDYKLVEEHFEAVGLPMMFLNRIKPMFLSALGGEDMFSLGSGEESQMVSYEMELMQMAQGRQLPIEGLETAEYQMSMFDSIPYTVQAQMLVESIKSGSADDGQFGQMVELYKNQDLQGMQSMMADEASGIGGYEDLLLVRRNRNWIPVMGEMMMAKPTFFAVGAGHLGGDEGVVALLREAGYTVKPLK